MLTKWRGRRILTAPLALWYWHMRRCDLRYLWPALRQEALRQRGAMGWSYQEALDHAKGAFAVHARQDAPWLWLGNEEIARRIDRLTW